MRQLPVLMAQQRRKYKQYLLLTYYLKIFIKYLNEAAMLTIAHKVTTIMNSDKIMVLNDGKITEFDNPMKLLQNPNSEFK